MISADAAMIHKALRPTYPQKDGYYYRRPKYKRLRDAKRSGRIL